MSQRRTPHSLPAASTTHLLTALCRACRNAPASRAAHLPGYGEKLYTYIIMKIFFKTNLLTLFSHFQIE
jgi:hypothetical protein